MKMFFNESEKDKEKSKIIELSFGMNFEEIKDNFEEVDPNGEEKVEDKNKTIEAPADKEKETAPEADKKKKKKNKKK